MEASPARAAASQPLTRAEPAGGRPPHHATIPETPNGPLRAVVHHLRRRRPAHAAQAALRRRGRQPQAAPAADGAGGDLQGQRGAAYAPAVLATGRLAVRGGGRRALPAVPGIAAGAE